MPGFVLHPEAYTDLDEIWEYIATDNLDAADRVLEEIYQAVRSLATFPHQGHTRPDLTTKPLRFQSVRDYVIAYIADENLLCVENRRERTESDPGDELSNRSAALVNAVRRRSVRRRHRVTFGHYWHCDDDQK